MLPLDNIKVLDLTRVLAGPWCTMTLGDLGAEVWKIEHPRGGDDTRAWRPPEIGSESTYFLCTNRNKRSVAIDLKTADGQALVRELAGKADVLVENMRLGALDRLGLGWNDLHRLNPRLIYCSLSGYGRFSPRAADPGYDAVIQAESGLMSITGAAEGEPMKHGVAITDIVCGMNASQAILAALLMRTRTNEGQFIDIALLDGALALLTNVGSGYLNTGAVPARYGNSHPTVVPYGIFEAADGGFVLGCGNDRQFRATCISVLGRPEIADDVRFRRNQDRHANREVLIPLLTELFAAASAQHWVGLLMAADVPAAVIRSVPQALDAPEARARGLIQTMQHPGVGPVSVVASPLRLENLPASPLPPPLLGEHTRNVLQNVLGRTEPEIQRLLASGVLYES
ncbi:CaiB/BaiF CoA-transferase family protein [Xanthobacter autotrophicus]|uniref:CaiB/BaiF CoA transferase family protein n=1 Tax=Xanthobacter autotrophicus TaxID=280 RepID=UPI003727B729